MGEFSALKKAIDDSMATIKAAKNAIKDAINTVGEPLGVRVDDTDTFRSYGEHLTGKPEGQSDYIRLLYQRIWSSDDNTDAPKKCIITNDDFPAAPMHNYGYIDINDKSAKEFVDEDKYVAVSSFIVNIQNPPVPILSEDKYFFGQIVAYTPSGSAEDPALPVPWDESQPNHRTYVPLINYQGYFPIYHNIEVDSFIRLCKVLIDTDGDPEYYSSTGFMELDNNRFIAQASSYYGDAITVKVDSDGTTKSFVYMGYVVINGYRWGMWVKQSGGN